MTIDFVKYQGTGNDFILIDNRKEIIVEHNRDRIAFLCDRHFGIGADGLILLENHDIVDFKMTYFNSDGNQSTMCGNGGRCIAHFAKSLGLISDQAVFEAIDGYHEVRFEDDLIALSMSDVNEINVDSDSVILNTGSPHFVTMTDNVLEMDVKLKGAAIRNRQDFKSEGINVNFVSQKNREQFVARTYERGVEDETLSCGTGVTAVAIAMHKIGLTESETVKIDTLGGNLKVRFNPSKTGYENIWLVGPAKQVYKGSIKW